MQEKTAYKAVDSGTGIDLGMLFSILTASQPLGLVEKVNRSTSFSVI